MESVKPLEDLSLQANLRQNWRRWVQRFDLYLLASGKIKEKEDFSARFCFMRSAKKRWKSTTLSNLA